MHKTKFNWCSLLVCCSLAAFGQPLQAQTTLNVTSYGAVGDAVQFYVNTVSNSPVVTTVQQLSSADIGKTIEVFTVGPQTYGVNSYGTNGYGNQDLVTTITDVQNGTNIYLADLPQATRLNAFATYGTDNTPAFNAAIAAAAPYPDATIYIPDGTYLCIPVWRLWYFSSIFIQRGGLHFVGQSRDNTVLLSKGAWTKRPGYTNDCWRGFLVEIRAPVTNDLPLSFENLTMDGGVQQGNIPIHGIYPNPVDGLGWDVTSDAYITGGGTSGTATHQRLANVTFQHWRGEMLKSIDQNKNGNITITNCAFLDGNATALNIYPSLNCRDCVFSNLFQIAEIYQEYYTNAAYFCNNFATNITYNGWAFNGGVWTAPPFLMQSNVFYFTGVGFNGIQTMPGANISILDNEIHCADYMTVFNLGAPGAQGEQMNSNILISGNSIYAPSKLTTIFGFGGDGVNGISGLTICSNTVSVADQIFFLTRAGGNATNVSIHDNQFTCAMAQTQLGVSGAGNTPFVLFPTNNPYIAYPTYVDSVKTTLISYSQGPQVRLDYVATTNLFVLNDSEAKQIPSGASITFDNTRNRWNLYHNDPGDVRVQPSQKSTATVAVPFGQAKTFYWGNNQWTTNALPTVPAPLPVIRNLMTM